MLSSPPYSLILFAVDPAPKPHSFILYAIPGAAKGRLELLSEEQPHLSAAFSVYPQWLQFITESNQEDDDKPQKQQFNLVRTKQVLWAYSYRYQTYTVCGFHSSKTFKNFWQLIRQKPISFEVWWQGQWCGPEHLLCVHLQTKGSAQGLKASHPHFECCNKVFDIPNICMNLCHLSDHKFSSTQNIPPITVT